MTIQTHPREERPLSAPWLLFRISEQLERLKQEPEWKDRGHDSLTLMKSPGLTVVLIAMRAGEVMREHQASGPVAIQIIQGRVQLHFTGDNPEVCAGEFATVDPTLARLIGHPPTRMASLIR